MNKKLKNILGIIGFILLFAFVVYMKTERKLKRTNVIKPDNTEQMNNVIEVSKQNEAKAFEEAQQKEKQKTAEEPTTKIETTGDFDWLLGNWIRLGEEEGKETFEYWKAISISEYSGIGFTMQNQISDTNETYSLDLKGPTFSVTKGETENADLTVIVKSENMTKLITGALKPQQAFMKGKLKIKGKMNLAMKLTAVLSATRKKMPMTKL